VTQLLGNNYPSLSIEGFACLAYTCDYGCRKSGDGYTHTFNLDNLPTYQDWLSAVSGWLRQLTHELGGLCEEWIVADVEDVPDQYVGEYAIDEAYWQYREAVESSYLDESVFQAAAKLDISPAMVEELYQGEHDNDEDFANLMAEDVGLLQ